MQEATLCKIREATLCQKNSNLGEKFLFNKQPLQASLSDVRSMNDSAPKRKEADKLEFEQHT